MNVTSTIIQQYTQSLFQTPLEIIAVILLTVVASILGCRVKNSTCTREGKRIRFKFEASQQSESKDQKTDQPV
jgi:peptidoglycan biosynthesis protein MviN/MurJ (putative lipid II flippase)